MRSLLEEINEKITTDGTCPWCKQIVKDSDLTDIHENFKEGKCSNCGHEIRLIIQGSGTSVYNSGDIVGITP